MGNAALGLLLLFLLVQSGLLLAPRLTAQLAMGMLPLAAVLTIIQPLMFFGGVQVIYIGVAWTVAWYAVFALPRELADHHADRLATQAQDAGRLVT
jgi:hypothetical protein